MRYAIRIPAIEDALVRPPQAGEDAEGEGADGVAGESGDTGASDPEPEPIYDPSLDDASNAPTQEIQRGTLPQATERFSVTQAPRRLPPAEW